ncbi:tRNA uridine-5-carboxymethylaminomethyl(34) synthesis GTPase MnmE [Sphingosinicella rhizophila]|uniref:tRNA modification GTPase MnmE n=1 Tax=Sphingosinicella rhizophila TaxID=3050082 RepID=A0ABU3Q820_9SPHN|nr:tRNA uridine-5-carboxymethylaminomethyl(34) synthesis GTPase MnmE [Sphingosinicella sp. GR2756]MDT9599559.1 tRNA uridine-5-carboxymethylaminomethyl(34) synthesis GTPase MnmE [Sphingosinicella sp. GR2756]
MTGTGRDTIYALSSGSPPAAVAIVRISGPAALVALQQLTDIAPALPRHARLATLRHPVGGEALDRALVLHFTGPDSATGEDVAELHLHGGRAVIASVLAALCSIDGLRPAEAGEFTRRSFENGRVDLAEAEGLADLLLAETESQRRAALALAGGSVSHLVEDWQRRVLALAADVEACLDFSDEGDVAEGLPSSWHEELARLAEEMGSLLSRPAIERLRDGLRVSIAGPPNAGKSSLLNALAGREAAIISDIAGTTRDLIEAPTAIGGAPFLLIDTAGLRDGADEIEAIGISRTRLSLEQADIILWLGAPCDCPDPPRSIIVQAKADLNPRIDARADIRVSAVTGQNMGKLIELLIARAEGLLPKEGEVAINARHQAAIQEARSFLDDTKSAPDLLIVAESLRLCRVALDKVTGRAGVEDMLDALFGRFCIGK